MFNPKSSRLPLITLMIRLLSSISLQESGQGMMLKRKNQAGDHDKKGSWYKTSKPIKFVF
jgi:hypothetical protein